MNPTQGYLSAVHEHGYGYISYVLVPHPTVYPGYPYLNFVPNAGRPSGHIASSTRFDAPQIAVPTGPYNYSPYVYPIPPQIPNFDFHGSHNQALGLRVAPERPTTQEPTTKKIEELPLEETREKTQDTPRHLTKNRGRKRKTASGDHMEGKPAKSCKTGREFKSVKKPNPRRKINKVNNAPPPSSGTSSSSATSDIQLTLPLLIDQPPTVEDSFSFVYPADNIQPTVEEPSTDNGEVSLLSPDAKNPNLATSIDVEIPEGTFTAEEMAYLASSPLFEEEIVYPLIHGGDVLLLAQRFDEISRLLLSNRSQTSS